GVRLGHLPSSKARRAAATASSTSALSPSATNANTSSLAGLMVSKVLPDFAATHLPLISNLVGDRRRKSSTALTFAPCAARSTDGSAAVIVVVLEKRPALEKGGGSHANQPPNRLD